MADPTRALSVPSFQEHLPPARSWSGTDAHLVGVGSPGSDLHPNLILEAEVGMPGAGPPSPYSLVLDLLLPERTSVGHSGGLALGWSPQCERGMGV